MFLFLMLLGAYFRNVGLIVLSCLFYLKPVFIAEKAEIFVKYELEWSYGILFFFFLVNFRYDVKDWILRVLFGQRR